MGGHLRALRSCRSDFAVRPVAIGAQERGAAALGAALRGLGVIDARADHRRAPGRRGHAGHRLALARAARRNRVPLAHARRRRAERHRQRARRGARRHPDRGAAGGPTHRRRQAVLHPRVRLRVQQERRGGVHAVAARFAAARRVDRRARVQAARDHQRLHRHAARRPRPAPGGRDPGARGVRRVGRTPCAFPAAVHRRVTVRGRSRSSTAAPRTPRDVPMRRSPSTSANTIPLLGRSYAEIAAISRSQHRSQAFGSLQPLGVRFDYVQREATRVPRRRTPRPSGRCSTASTPPGRGFAPDVSGGARAALDSLPAAFAAARESFDPFEPQKSLPSLARIDRHLRAHLRDCVEGPRRASSADRKKSTELGAAGVAGASRVASALALAAGVTAGCDCASGACGARASRCP